MTDKASMQQFHHQFHHPRRALLHVAAISALTWLAPLPVSAGTLLLVPEEDNAPATTATHDAPDAPDAPPTEPGFDLTILIDNDGGLIKRNHPTDRHYTSGVALSLTLRPQWADDLAERIYTDPAARTTEDTAVGLFAGQLIFTPRNITREDLIEDDRPYAGYLFGGLFWQRASDKTQDHVRLEIGMVGPSSRAETAQRSAHSIGGGDEPQGWDNQLHDEFVGQLYYQRKLKFTGQHLGTQNWPVEIEVLPDYGLALGTVYRHLDLGATLRAGWNLPSDFGPARIDDLSGTAGRLDQGWGLYTFARLAGRFVEHNIFLEGNTYEDSHSVDEERWLARFQAGVRLHYRTGAWSLELGYDQTFLSTEFEQQSGGDEYASLMLGITGHF